jgi:hypothetical protein
VKSQQRKTAREPETDQIDKRHHRAKNGAKNDTKEGPQIVLLIKIAKKSHQKVVSFEYMCHSRQK